jgi:hypothetical protein
MKYPPFNGWLTWSYNDVKYGRRTCKEDVFKMHVDVSNVPANPESYYKELYTNASMIRDYYTGEFDVLLSGGIDSEVVVRTFKDLKIPHNTYIFKYENNINYRDVSSAVEIAEGLNIPYKVIDFNLEQFFEREAYDFFKKSGCVRAGALPHLKFFDYLDNIPIMGDCEPYWYRTLQSDYTKLSEWTFPLDETHHNASMYLHRIGRENVCDWYEFNPNLIRAFNDLPIIQDLINDRIPGKCSSWSSRTAIHRVLWPDIQLKVKLTGYESSGDPGVYPEFINKIQERMTSEVGDGAEYRYTYSQLKELLG